MALTITPKAVAPRIGKTELTFRPPLGKREDEDQEPEGER